MSHALHHEAVFQRPIRQVFDLITTTGHWPKWHPATQAVSGQTLQPGRLGDECTETVRTAGFFRGHVSWRVVGCEAPVRWAMASTDIALPLLSGATVRLEYALEEHGRGTRLLRTFEYELPAHLWLFDVLYFRAKMKNESVEALRRLTALVDGSTQTPAERLESNVEERSGSPHRRGDRAKHPDEIAIPRG